MLLLFYNLSNSQNIPVNQNSKLMLVTRTPPTLLKRLQKLHRKKSNNWPMVYFIHNGSEKTTLMGYSFKTKRTKFKATFLNKDIVF